MSQSNAIFLGCLFFVHAQLFIARSPQSPCSCVQELFHSIIMLYPELVTFSVQIILTHMTEMDPRYTNSLCAEYRVT